MASKLEQRRAGASGCALLWNLDAGTERGDAVRSLLDAAGIEARTVTPAMLIQTPARILGSGRAHDSHGPRGHVAGAPACEFMLLCGVPSDTLQGFLAASREAGAVVGCKAVLTDANRIWPLGRLISEVAAEHAAMHGHA